MATLDFSLILSGPCDVTILRAHLRHALSVHRMVAPRRRDIPMRHTPTPPTPELASIDCPVSEAAIAQLVGQVYEIAPPAERSRLLEHLLKPLGVLSLVAIANG